MSKAQNLVILCFKIAGLFHSLWQTRRCPIHFSTIPSPIPIILWNPISNLIPNTKPWYQMIVLSNLWCFGYQGSQSVDKTLLDNLFSDYGNIFGILQNKSRDLKKKIVSVFGIKVRWGRYWCRNYLLGPMVHAEPYCGCAILDPAAAYITSLAAYSWALIMTWPVTCAVYFYR